MWLQRKLHLSCIAGNAPGFEAYISHNAINLLSDITGGDLLD